MTVPVADSFPPGRPWPGRPGQESRGLGSRGRRPAVPARPARRTRPPGRAGLARDPRLACPGPGAARLPGRATLPGLDRPG